MYLKLSRIPAGFSGSGRGLPGEGLYVKKLQRCFLDRPPRIIFEPLEGRQARQRLFLASARQAVKADMAGNLSNTTLLTLVAKRRLKPFFHGSSDKILYRLGVIDVWECKFGDG